MRNATTYAVNSVVNNVRTGTRLMRIAMSSEAKHASPNNMEMNDFAVALACIPYDCQPYTDVSTSSRGKRKNGRKRRAVSRKYRQLRIVYRVNNQGEIGVVPEKLRTLDRGRPWRDSQFASTRLSPSRDMSR